MLLRPQRKRPLRLSTVNPSSSDLWHDSFIFNRLKLFIMENKGNFFAGLAIMVGLIVVGINIPKAIQVMSASQRNVSVRGLCEREVAADKVIWPLTYNIAGDDLSALYRQLEANNDAIKSFLKSGGIDDSEITTSTPNISDVFTQEYGGNNRRYRYVIKSTTTVSTGKVDNVLSLMDKQGELIRNGITLCRMGNSNGQGRDIPPFTVQVPQHLFVQRKHSLGIIHHHTPLVRHMQFIIDSFEQADTQFRFKRMDMLTDRRLCQRKGFRGPGIVSRFNNL